MSAERLPTGNELLSLRLVAQLIDVPYDRLAKQRQRDPDGFPTEEICGVRFHRPADVAEYQGTISRGRPRAHET